MDTVYFLHFTERDRHAGHYLGSTNDLPKRLAEHDRGRGARLLAVIKAAGITWTLARTWEGGKHRERQLKRQGGASGSVATLHVRGIPLCYSHTHEVKEGGRMDFKGSQFEREIILWGVRWYVAYPMSYRQLEEMMGERGVAVDHSTLNRWVIKYAPEMEKQFRRRQSPVGRSWRMDETYVKIKGKWAYLYRAVDKEGHTIDFLLTPNRDRDAAEVFLRKAIRTQGLPEKITIDKSGANTAAITHYNKTHRTTIIIRHSKYLNNIVEQDHRAVKRIARPMLGFKSFWAARCTVAGIEVMHAIRKGQLGLMKNMSQTPAEQFYALAA